MMRIELKIIDKDLYADYPLPNYATSGSAAIDLIWPKTTYIEPQERRKINTGIAIHIGSSVDDKNKPTIKDRNYDALAALIMPRSGLGTKGIVLANTVGVIDEDYQGELIVSVWNSLENIGFDNVNVIHLYRGERFAQLMFVPIIKPKFKVVEEFSEQTSRHIGGFGSTGR